MINIEQELEFGSTLSPSFHPGNIRLEGDVIVCDVVYNTGSRVYDYNWRFDAKTGIYISSDPTDSPHRLRPKSKVAPVTNYFLFAGQPEWAKDQWVKMPGEKFSDGRSAAERMKYHNGLFSSCMSPFRVMVKSETETTTVCDYPGWAEFRFESGEWQKLPWADEPWFKDNVPAHHYAHISVEDGVRVAYWDTAKEAQADAVTVITPGRYLTRFFSDHLTSTQIQKWAVKVDIECELKFAKTEDEIYEVYSHPNSPNSCMKGDDDDSDFSAAGMNPTRVYGAGDLAIAYLERKGKIVARALCWPEKKIFGRIYGDIDRLQLKLEAEGFKMDVANHDAGADNGGGFVGARLLLIRPDDYPNAFVMPYIDSSYGVTRFPKDHEHFSKYLKMVQYPQGTICCSNTCGISDDPDEDDNYDTYCEDCGTGMYDDDSFYIGGWGNYCEGCYDRRAVDCHKCEETIHRSDAHTVEDEYYCETCFDEHTFMCDCCSERTCSVEKVFDARDIETVAFEACASCVENDDEIQPNTDGTLIHTETATKCENEACGAYFSGDLSPNQCPSCNPAANDTQTEEMEAA